MHNLMFIILFICFSFGNAIAADGDIWCHWVDESTTDICRTETAGHIFYNHAKVYAYAPELNPRDIYKTTFVVPIYDNSTHRLGDWIDDFSTKTKTGQIIALTQDEINLIKCNDFKNTIWLAKKLVAKGVLAIGDFTAQEQEIYQACD